MTEKLLPCPFCTKPLTLGGGVNPYGRCETADCWLAERRISISLEDPKQLEQWNRRTPAPEGEAVAWRWRNKPDGVWNYQEARQRIPGVEQQPLYASPVVPVGREDIEVVAEWLEMAKETPKPLHSSLNYVPVCASEIEAIERILAALGTKATDTGREA
jgi:hypothetical protein